MSDSDLRDLVLDLLTKGAGTPTDDWWEGESISSRHFELTCVQVQGGGEGDEKSILDRYSIFNQVSSFVS